MRLATARNKAAAYWELTKPGIAFLVLISTSIGYYLGGKTMGGFDWAVFVPLIIGSSLAAGGVAALNEYYERALDARMHRTMNRPLPSGRLSPREALIFAVTISAAGIILLALKVHPGTGLLAFITLVAYIFIYTPLKQVTTWNTLIGAVPGALPPLGGWLAATGNLSAGAWALFIILFAWQIPHFLAIATLYRDDYPRAGMKMLPSMDESGVSTARHIVIFCLLALAGSIMPTALNLTGWPYLAGAFLLGLMFLKYGISAARSRGLPQARKLLFASIIYLPALLLAMVADLEFFG